MDPRPEIDERVFWGVEREGVKPLSTSKSFPRTRFWGALFYWFALVSYSGHLTWKYAARDESGQVMLDELLRSLLWPAGGTILAVLSIYIIIRGVNILPKYSVVRGKAMPLWLSSHRLTYVPAKKIFGTSLPLEHIQNAALDYVDGSLAVRLKTATETMHLLSSDAKNLLHHLYTLRPELEPSS